jgi:transposase
MSFIQPQLHATETEETEDAGVAAVNQVEAEIREFVRRDGRHLRRTQDTAGEIFATNVNSLVQRVAGSSLREIDNLIHELETLRETLQNEGERVQRELTNYAHLSQSAMESIKLNAEAMMQLRAASDPSQTH